MKIVSLTTVLFVVFAFAKAYTAQAQSDFKAVATYMSQTKIDIKLDSAKTAKMNSDPMYKQIMEGLSKPNNQEYKLEFTATESSYEEVKELAKPQKPTNGFSISITSSGGVASTIYKDLTAGEYTKKDQIMGKDFIIIDKLPTYNWQLHNETKKIGNFTCFKATYLPEPDEIIVEEKEEKEDDKEKTGLLDMATSDYDPTITAWYTPDIQVSNGPGEYHGLPGLIVEVKQDNTIILLQTIEMNPDKGLKLEKPKGGKKINQEDFDALQKKKMDEMMKNRSSGNGTFQVISIGG